MDTKTIYQKWQQVQYYVIIGVISLIALFFLPMLGSTVGLAFKLPNTVAGWIVYCMSKALVATINVLTFHCFILQGKINIRDNPEYLEAKKILNELETSDADVPRSPKQWTTATYGKKGITIFVTSALSAIGLTQAILAFDWVSMLTYLFTVIMGLIFGILQMNQTEIYWTEEYKQYAMYIQRKRQEAEEKARKEEELQRLVEREMALVEAESVHERNDPTNDSGGTDLLESIDSSSPISNT